MNKYTVPRDEFAAAMHIDVGCQMCPLHEVREENLRSELAQSSEVRELLSRHNVALGKEAKRIERQNRALWAFLCLNIAGLIYTCSVLAGAL